jgi:DNA-binding transcriptional LysR family regulator
MKQEIEMRHLRYFVAVAETLHFGRAADKLRMAQPPLSQQIRNLERNLGYSLFDRTTRGVRLTRVGEFFLERSRNTLAKVGDDVEMARRLADSYRTLPAHASQRGVATTGACDG